MDHELIMNQDFFPYERSRGLSTAQKIIIQYYLNIKHHLEKLNFDSIFNQFQNISNDNALNVELV